MSGLKRKTLFIGAVIVFITLSPLVVLFAQGNRIDFGSQGLYPTGGLYVKTENVRANLYVDGESKGRTSRFASGFEPGLYQVVVKKPGYSQWTKKICILPYKVTVIQDIQLVSTSPVLAPTTSPLPGNPAGEKEGADLGEGDFEKAKYIGNGFYLSRSDGSEQRSLYFVSEKNQSTKLVLDSISEFRLAPDSNKAIFWSQDNQANLIWLRDNFWLKKKRGQIDQFLDVNPEKVAWHNDSFYIFYLKNSNLYWVEVDDRSGCTSKQSDRNSFLLKEDVDDYFYSSERGLYVKKDGQWYEVALTTLSFLPLRGSSGFF